MSSFIIEGGECLKGTVRTSSAKNAVLPVMAASLLAEGECVIEDVPELEDVRVMREVLSALGARCETKEGSLRIIPDNIDTCEAPYELVRKMRASFLVMGPLLAKYGWAKISLPGGCAIGSRPIDLHLKGFTALGAEINLGHGSVEARCEKLKGSVIYLDFPSVGATENIMMAAALAEGQTVIENAAKEPEIVDLANFLNSMGAYIRGAGTDVIKIEGVRNLKGISYTVIPDRIEAGTFLIAGAITNGDVLVENVVSEHLKPLIAKLIECGAEVIEGEDGIRVVGRGRPNPVDVKTMPYPGFPTDMQAQMMAYLSLCTGTSMVTETVFENRFMHVEELKRMGAKIKIEGKSAIVEGVEKLSGAPVKATDLRAGAALILAGLAAEGTTEVMNAYHVDRGYENIVEKFQALGAKIKRAE
ncbi:UDP-N-acetylglucosamine 1-carboxyvinyltransferase [Thermosediminibacter oceani]|uniref:UDP-N-acetylglucosamine 1-carboxyvinyltransferase n=1 Tax=Thermosediminibacter oceani (strain ATCC BAA-1034 / DSM 16646 / JW/IW-1228P) TaxID=555079 RepID=D9RZW0_THEOJ|nr:UDP-N-acetylglucosamine 1-carboxyvinyltransferase [Thermosediminibacter oceani]ADL08737.1 UDP-N-acetylglucosamine 1-carboxyvinyltransferase [Thermosediminibacter oceani DSM 16646]